MLTKKIKIIYFWEKSFRKIPTHYCEGLIIFHTYTCILSSNSLDTLIVLVWLIKIILNLLFFNFQFLYSNNNNTNTIANFLVIIKTIKDSK